MTQPISAMPPQGTDPNTYAAQYAQQNGISLDEAKTKLKSPYGDPQKPQNAMTSSAQTVSTSDDTQTAPLADRRRVHSDDKRWLKRYHKENPHLSKAQVRQAFIDKFGRIPA